MLMFLIAVDILPYGLFFRRRRPETLNGFCLLHLLRPEGCTLCDPSHRV